MASYIRLTLLSLFISLFFSAAYSQTAGFRADYSSGCAPLLVNFTNTSTGATSYYWDLGNGITTALTNPSTTYLTPGTYTVTLTAYNGSSTSVSTMTITVYPSPTVSFYADDTAVCPGTYINFTSTSTPGVSGAMTYLWNFGDGSSSTAASPSHAYGTPGNFHVTLTVTNSMGCVTTLTKSSYITVYTRPTAAFTSTGPGFCHPPATATFTSLSSGTAPLTYAWSFGDGGTSTAASPSHTYGGTGVYTVRLYVTDANGCTDSIIRVNYISVSNTVASFTSVSSACLNTVVAFNNTSPYHITSYWTFGDGGYSVADSATHAYTSPGTYNVRLIIYNGTCYDTVTQTITIFPAPSGSISYSPTNPCPAPATITFTGTVAAGTSVAWEFGDGGTGTGSTTAHTYAANGVYIAKMIITDVNGCIDTIRRMVTINDLIFHLDPDVDEGCAPLSVRFFSTIFTSIPFSGVYPYATGSTYSWTFGDGGTSTSSFPTHVYTAPGVYLAKCTLTTANGCVAVDSITIRVGTPPHATFTASPLRVCLRDSVVFLATVDSGVIDDFVWIFGDGTTYIDSASRVTHRFSIPGYFTVTITPTFRGCYGTPWSLSDTIVVDSPMAVADIVYNCEPFTSMTFRNISWGSTSVYWSFGDGVTSTLDTVNHTYSAGGSYNVYLATYNSRTGCRDTARDILHFYPPNVNFLASDTAVCMEDTIRFYPAPGTDTMIRYQWAVDGILARDSDGDPYFTDTFRTPGRISISMIYEDRRGCWDTLTKPYWILVGKPADSFTVSASTACGPFRATLTDVSTTVVGTSLRSYFWDFGDGSTSTGSVAVTSHTYTAAGTYDIKSIVTDNIGCTDTLIRRAVLTVWRPRAAFSASSTYPCAGRAVTFTNLSSGHSSSYWLFGDGDTSSATSPSHIYNTPGVYTIKLIVRDTHGCTDTVTALNHIRVTRPDANFTMSDSFTICAPLNVNFYNSSTGATSYAWALGAGATSTLTSPNNLYTSSGVYTVTLVATNTYGCKDTAYRYVTLYGYAGAFSYTPDSGCAPLAVRFRAALSNVPSITWDFADGTTATASRLDTIDHIYAYPGSYLPKLILSDNTGCQNSSVGIDTIRVNAVYAGFTSMPYPICVNTDVTFIDTSRSFFSNVVSRSWLFWNGDTSTAATPSMPVNTVGSFPVKIVSIDGWGCIDSVTRNIVVNPPPDIIASKDTVICVGDTATLWGYGGVTYSWSPTATAICATCQPATVNPTVATTYTVTGIDTNGCFNTDTAQVRLRTNTESFAWGDTEVCRNIPVQLFDTGGTRYSWIPASGLNNPSIYNPIATPTVTTKYMVIAQLGSCIPDTNYVSVIVRQLPTVDAGIDQRVVAGTLVYLEANGTLIATYEWSPAYNLSCSSCKNPTATMMATQTYFVTVASSFGCKATDSVTIDVFCDESQIFIPNSFTPNGDGQNDVFYPRGSGISTVKAFRIYNRWGELVFEKTNFDINDASAAWDGTYKGGSARTDVFVYLLEATCTTGKPLFYKGDVTIIR